MGAPREGRNDSVGLNEGATNVHGDMGRHSSWANDTIHSEMMNGVVTKGRAARQLSI